MLINEFFPNPIGKDTEAEWIELFNNSQEAVNLSGWQIKDASGKVFVFKNQKIGSGEYLILDYKTTKISLNNNAETLFLYDLKGNLIDKVEFAGAAPEGKSLIRQNGQFIFTDKPTPGKANTLENLTTSVVAASGPSLDGPVIINNSQLNFTNLLIGLFISLALAVLGIFILKKLNLLSE